ncbi:MAG: serine dehydratase subunit alpha family protein [Deltaproteobacteria bacterium]|nr:serine dehydratase subunit alpha family protein [Deltaproteobacteria bacterium]
MDILEYIEQEWIPTLGCTEPASIAYAGITASKQISDQASNVTLTVDPKMYKNCHAVGIPHSGHKVGIKWAAAIGCFLRNTESKLECFREIDEEVLEKASELINADKIKIKIDRTKDNLFIDLEVTDGKDTGRCIIQGTHTNITRISKNGQAVFESKAGLEAQTETSARRWAASLSAPEILEVARDLNQEARSKVRNGSELNLKIAVHGLALFPESFVKMTEADIMTRAAGLVCAGVYARMWGEDFTVMSVAGSGNKGIVCSVPLTVLEEERNVGAKKVEEALVLSMLFTSKTTEALGTLSAVCGCANAAGIGLACGLVYLQDGGDREISFAINNMVGNVTGMICDGAKIGCALKTMTSVDAAFRACALAMSGIGIPFSDGIVGHTGSESLANLGKIAKDGMTHTDDEILRIMEEKL